MNLKRIGILLIFVGIFLSVFFIGDKTYLVPALTVTVLGFFITLVGFIEDVKKYFPNNSFKAYFGGLHMKGKENNQEICVYSDEQIKAMSKLIKKEKMNVYTGHCTGLIGYSKLSQLVPDFLYNLYSCLQVKL